MLAWLSTFPFISQQAEKLQVVVFVVEQQPLAKCPFPLEVQSQRYSLAFHISRCYFHFNPVQIFGFEEMVDEASASFGHDALPLEFMVQPVADFAAFVVLVEIHDADRACQLLPSQNKSDEPGARRIMSHTFPYVFFRIFDRLVAIDPR